MKKHKPKIKRVKRKLSKYKRLGRTNIFILCILVVFGWVVLSLIDKPQNFVEYAQVIVVPPISQGPSGGGNGPASGSAVPTVACQQDIKVCPDGAIVLRTGDECLFAGCPGEPGAGAGQGACQQDAKVCSDGSFVTRTGADCAFADCPVVAGAPGAMCLPVGACWFGFGCPADSTCNGLISGECISNQCTPGALPGNPPAPTPVIGGGPINPNCKGQSAPWGGIANIPWFVIGADDCN